MSDIEAKIDLRKVENALRRLQLAGHNLAPVFKSSRKPLRADQREHQKDQRGPDGKWPGLAPSTIKRRTVKGGGRRYRGVRRRKSRKLSRLLGRLPRDFKITFDARKLRAASRWPRSGVHQHPGRTIRANNGAVIPDRTFLWPSPDLLRHIAKAARDYLSRAWEKKP